jgi:hypothetical protein
VAKRAKQDRRKAADLFAEARRLEAERDYRGARKSYERSLRLYEDKTVREAYLKLLATVGPM